MTVQVFYDRAFKPVAHAIAGRRYLPLAVQNQICGVLPEFVVLRAHHDADRSLHKGRKINPALGRAARGRRLQFVARL